MDAALFFNGRFNFFSGVKKYLTQAKIPCLIHERGYMKGSFMLSIDEDPGNPFYTFSKWLKTDKVLTSRDIMNINNYVKGRLGGKIQNGFSYAGDDSSQALFTSLPTDRKYIVYFTSCSDEISGYDETATYYEQLKQIEWLSALVSANSDCYHLIIRCHPNLGVIGRHSSSKMFLSRLKHFGIQYSCITILYPDVNIKAGELADKAFICISPQSTLNMDLSLIGYRMLYINESPYRILYHDVSVSLYSLNTIEDLIQNSCIYVRKHSKIIELICWHYYIGSSITLRNAHIIDGFRADYTYDRSGPTCNTCLRILKLLITPQKGIITT